MKLLFDQNLSPKLVARLRDLFADSSHVKDCGLGTADDEVVWEYARSNGFAIGRPGEHGQFIADLTEDQHRLPRASAADARPTPARPRSDMLLAQTPRRYPMRALCSLITLAAFGLVCGCASEHDRRSELVSALSSPQRGISEEQLNSTWKAEGRHQFTALTDPDQGDRPARWVLLEYPLGRGRVPYYALFREGRLASIIDPSAMEQSLTGERRMRAAFQSSDLAGEAIDASASKRLAARDARVRDHDEEPLSRLVPRTIQLGMSINEVKARLGPPAAVRGPAMNTIVYAYGPRNAAEGSVAPVPFLSVTFVNGQVVRVFSGDFFDPALLSGERTTPARSGTQ